MSIRFILFDFDGTLIDSKKDIAVAANEALIGLGLKPLDNELIGTFVGSGLRELMIQCLRASGGEASIEHLDDSIHRFEEYYLDHCIDYTRWYPGVTETLNRLLKEGMTMALFTNKPRTLTLKILDSLNGHHFFSQVACGMDDFPKKPDPEGALVMMKEAGYSAEETLFVGDSHVDWETACNAGIEMVFVTYGFGKLSEVEGCAMKAQLDHFEDLQKVLKTS